MKDLTKFREALDRVEEEYKALELGHDEDIPEDLRYKLMVLASSTKDYLFWLHTVDSEEISDEEIRKAGGTWWEVLEVESGVAEYGLEEKDAVDKLFRADVLDLPRAGD